MKSNLYLTEYNSVRSRSQPKLNETFSNKRNSILYEHKTFRSKVKAFNSIKETMLDYIIKEETEYVDLNKCEKLFRELYYRNKTEMNQLLSEQSNKKQYLENIQSQIEKEVIINTKLSKENLVQYYKDEIKNLNLLLVKEKFNYEHYQNLFSQLTEESTNIKERIIECVESNERNNELFNKYQLIRKNAEICLTHQQGVLNEIKEFEKIRKDKFKEELAEKKSKFKDLEYKVFKVKAETVEIAKNIERLKVSSNQAISNIKIIRNKNIKLHADNNIMKREYNFRKIILLKLFKQFEVKSLDEVIHLFNEESRWCNSNLSLYMTINKEIREKNNDYKVLNDKYLQIQQKVESLKKTGVLQTALEDIDKSILEESVITNLTSQIEGIKKFNSYLTQKMFDKHNLIKSFFVLIYKYYPKFHKFDSSHGRKNTLDTSTDMDITNTFDKEKNWNINDIKHLLNVVINFQKKVMFYFTSMVFTFTLERVDNKDDKFEIIDPFEFNNDHIEGQFMKSLINLENKYKILLKSDSEIFSDVRTKDSGKKKDKTVTKIKTFDKVFENFQRHMQKEGLSTYQNILVKSKLKKHMSKLANDLIKDKEKDQDNNLTRRNAVAIENNNKEYNSQEPEIKQEDSEESYKDEQEKKKENVKELKEKNYFGYNPSSKKDKDFEYYQRLDGLNKLNSKVFIEKDENLINTEINEIYYKFKKRKQFNLKTISNSSIMINTLNQKNLDNKINGQLSSNKLTSMLKEKESFEGSRNRNPGIELNMRSISQNMNYTNITDRKNLYDTKKVIKSDCNATDILNTQYGKPFDKEMSNTLKTTIFSSSNRSNNKESSLSTIKNYPSYSNLKLKLPKI